jgi:preprotein translocase subunit SecD
MSRYAILAPLLMLLAQSSASAADAGSQRLAPVPALALRFVLDCGEAHASPPFTTRDGAQTVCLAPEIVADAGDIEDASAVTLEYGVALRLLFTADGSRKIETATSQHIGERLAILVGGEVVMAPMIRDAIAKEAMISGNFTKEEVSAFARTINQTRRTN